MYVDGFLLPLPKTHIEEYKKIVGKTEAYFKNLGAIDYVECIGDDVPYGTLTSFPRAVMATDDEVVILSWVTYPSREVRDAANKKMMSDPDMMELMKDIPIDGKRMIFGGFNPVVGL